MKAKDGLNGGASLANPISFVGKNRAKTAAALVDLFVTL
jgi:hypothetical protein